MTDYSTIQPVVQDTLIKVTPQGSLQDVVEKHKCSSDNLVVHESGQIVVPKI